MRFGETQGEIESLELHHGPIVSAVSPTVFLICVYSTFPVFVFVFMMQARLVFWDILHFLYFN